MYSMLNVILGYSEARDEVELYNMSFFSKYLDIEKAQKLAIIQRKYRWLCELLEKRYNSDIAVQEVHYKTEISKTQKSINELYEVLKELEAERVERSGQLTKLYSDKTYDSTKIKILENEMKDISKLIATKHSELEKLVNKKMSLLGQQRKNNAVIASQMKSIKEYYDELNKDMEEVDFSKLNIFNCFKSPEIRSKYEEGLTKYIPNPEKRKAYVDYFYKITSKEAEFIMSTIVVAYNYLKKANKNNGYHVPKFDAQNMQIYNHINLLSHISYCVAMWLGRYQDKQCDPIVAATYKEVEGFVDGMLDYSGNFEKYDRDPELEEKAFNELLKQVNEISIKSEEKRPRILGVIPKFGSTSIEDSAYVDLAQRAFNDHVRIIRSIYKSSKLSRVVEAKSKDKTSSKFKPVIKEVKQKEAIKQTMTLPTIEEEHVMKL